MRYQKTGLVYADRTRATPGFTLFCPMHHRIACLLDIEGEIVHQWELPDWPANYARLLPNGNLLAAELRAVHALQIHQIAAVVDDGDEHFPAVLDGLGVAGGGDLLSQVECKTFLGGEHVC
mgnify:CR=1 FL=1